MITAGGYHDIRLFLKGRYFLMIYVGIDVAKLNHFTSLIFSDRKSLLGRSNFQTTVMASGISFPPSNHSTAKGSASVLNQRSLCRPPDLLPCCRGLQYPCTQSTLYFFHAPAPSSHSPCKDFPRSFKKGTGGRIKSSGTEVGRSIRPGTVHPDHFRDC